jgi:hypothetical protein
VIMHESPAAGTYSPRGFVRDGSYPGHAQAKLPPTTS